MGGAAAGRDDNPGRGRQRRAGAVQLSYRLADETVTLTVRTEAGAYNSTRTGEKPDRWRLKPGDTPQGPRPGERVVDLYLSQASPAPLIVGRVHVRYYPARGGGWPPFYRLEPAPELARTPARPAHADPLHRHTGGERRGAADPGRLLPVRGIPLRYRQNHRSTAGSCARRKSRHARLGDVQDAHVSRRPWMAMSGL